MNLHCPKCRYDLTGLSENRCPECGQPFDPATLAQSQSIRRPGWRVALPAVLVCAYAPFAFWIPFQSQDVWWWLWPIMPGFYFGFLLHPREPLEFIVMGAATLIILGGATYLASRRWWLLPLVCILLTLWTALMSWGGWGVSKM